MRKERSIKNAITAVISNFIVLLFGFILQKIFIKTLGDEYLGVNTLFTNIISMLSIADLGIGIAIIYSLYKPIAEGNKEEIKSLMRFYKKTYNIIALSVTLISIALLPFLHFFVTTNLDINLYLIFMLFVADVVCSYLLSYKRSIIQADQRSYIINIVHILYSAIMNTLLIITLYTTKNYVLFLVIKCICRILENIVISKYANRIYPYINESAKKLDKETYDSIFKKVKGLMFHKVGSFAVLGTDNIIISKFLGNIVVAYYSNYYMIINAASLLLSQLFSSLTASVGNLLVKDTEEKSYNLYKKLMFANFWIYSFAATGMFVAMQPVIILWVGEERLLSLGVLAILVANFYMMGMRASIGVYKEAAGIYYEDRFIPVIESVLNIVISIILVKKMGLIGVFVGTMLSSFVVVFFSLPYFVYKRVFKRKMTEYYKLYFKYLLLTIVCVTLTHLIVSYILSAFSIVNPIISLILGIVVATIVPNAIYIILFRRSAEYKYFLEIGKKAILKITERGGIHEENNG